MVTAPSICIARSGGSQSDEKASTRYLEKERQMMANMAGFRIMMDIQAKRKAGRCPNAVMKYVCSAPEVGIMQPNST